jgi:glycosyltransferase involved in cell wall biosynthesis
MIILVSELYYPEEISTGYILTKIAEGLALNYPVQVITGPPDYSGLKDSPKIEIRNKVKIERVTARSLNKNKIASRLLRSILLSFKLMAKTIKLAKKGDTIFIVTNPAPLLILMTFVSWLTRTSLVVLVHDVFPENLEAAGILKSNSFFYRFLLDIFNLVYKAADHIIVIGRDMEKIMTDKIKSTKPGISLITNWADTSEVFPTDRSTNPIIKKFHLENKFIVQFAGNIGRVQGIEHMFKAALKLEDENIHFIFIGDGAKKRWLLDQVKKHKLSNVTVLDFMPRKDQQVFLNACDIGLVSLAPGMTGLGVPSKTYNILAAGKPVIAIVDPLSEIGLVVNEEKIGWVVKPSDINGLILAIREASKSQLLGGMGDKARKIAENKYALELIIQQYTGAFGPQI